MPRHIKTAALGLAVPPLPLARDDKVIECGGASEGRFACEDGSCWP